MTMFNSLAYATKLVNTGLPRAQAEVHAQELQEVPERIKRPKKPKKSSTSTKNDGVSVNRKAIEESSAA